MSEKVLILLSTYNGEKYLEEQLNTILNQTTEEISDRKSVGRERV